MSPKLSFKPKEKKTPEVPTKVSRPADIEKPTPTPRPSQPRKPRASYKPLEKGDLFQVIFDTTRGNIPVKPKTVQNMKKHFAENPFGGHRKGGGGWNATAYAIFEAIVKSERFYIKK